MLGMDELEGVLMSISLTKDQLFDRLLDPERVKLLRLAFDEDARSVFPLRSQTTSQTEINPDMAKTLTIVAEKLLLRAISLTYDETL